MRVIIRVWRWEGWEDKKVEGWDEGCIGRVWREEGWEDKDDEGWDEDRNQSLKMGERQRKERAKVGMRERRQSTMSTMSARCINKQRWGWGELGREHGGRGCGCGDWRRDKKTKDEEKGPHGLRRCGKKWRERVVVRLEERGREIPFFVGFFQRLAIVVHPNCYKATNSVSCESTYFWMSIGLKCKSMSSIHEYKIYNAKF